MEPSLLQSQKTIDALKNQIDSLQCEVQTLRRRLKSKDLFILHSIIKQRRVISPPGNECVADHHLLYNKHMMTLQEWKPTTEILEEMASVKLTHNMDMMDKENTAANDGVWNGILSQYMDCMTTISVQSDRLDRINSDSNLLELVNHRRSLSVEF